MKSSGVKAPAQEEMAERSNALMRSAQTLFGGSNPPLFTKKEVLLLLDFRTKRKVEGLGHSVVVARHILAV